VFDSNLSITTSVNWLCISTCTLYRLSYKIIHDQLLWEVSWFSLKDWQAADYFVPCSWGCCCCRHGGFPNILGLWGRWVKLTAQRATPDMAINNYLTWIESWLGYFATNYDIMKNASEFVYMTCKGTIQNTDSGRHHCQTAKCRSNWWVSLTRPLCKCHGTGCVYKHTNMIKTTR